MRSCICFAQSAALSAKLQFKPGLRWLAAVTRCGMKSTSACTAVFGGIWSRNSSR
jgi:hypothetical protein